MREILTVLNVIAGLCVVFYVAYYIVWRRLLSGLEDSITRQTERASSLLAAIESKHERANRLALDLGRTAQCPICGQHALAGRFCESSDYLCPDCGTKLRWGHVNGRAYVLYVPSSGGAP